MIWGKGKRSLKPLEAQVKIWPCGYDVVAPEYYDKTQHPTCHNFNFLSRRYIATALSNLVLSSQVIEVGCGESSVAPILHEQHLSLKTLLLTDASSAMLEYS